MGDNRDLEDLAKSSTDDFYELLGVAFDADAAAIQKAYRKASIRYHPDKNPDDKNAADRFIALGWARDILIDEKLKGEYDRARTRRREKALQDELLDGRRRKMKEDLERRERASKDWRNDLKRKRTEDLNEVEKREMEVQRLAEDGRRRVKELQERLEKRRREEESSFMDVEKSPEPQAPKPGDSPEMERAVKIRFQREGDTVHWDKDRLTSMFSKYGKVDMVVLLKDKKVRPSGEKHRKVTAVALIIYTRIDHAHAAIMDAKSDYPTLESVSWAKGAPDIMPHDAPTAPSTPSVPKSNIPTTTMSLEEMTMMKLKEAGRRQAEKKKLEEQTRKDEAEKNAVPTEQPFGTPLRPVKKAPGTPLSTPLGTPKFSFSPKTTPNFEGNKIKSKQAEKRKLEEQIRQQEAAEEAAEKMM
jgi:DnaJ family protein C protein 17